MAADSHFSRNTKLPLQGKTVMVTGSSSGIGKSIALELAHRGANLILHGRTHSEQLTAVHQQIDQSGRETTYQLADFTDLETFGSFVEQAWNWRGKIDCWINNAGGDVLTGDWPCRPLHEKLEYLLRVDVMSSLILSRAIGKKMTEYCKNHSDPSAGHFSIINMGWDQAWQGMGGENGELFATTKGAIMSMTKSLAQSLAPVVRVNCLAPGWIKTTWGENASPYWSQRAKRESLMNRWGNPQDVASAAAFLCADESSFISGQILPINGGFRYSISTSEHD